jgi:hypothetical protein
MQIRKPHHGRRGITISLEPGLSSARLKPNALCLQMAASVMKTAIRRLLLASAVVYCGVVGGLQRPQWSAQVACAPDTTVITTPFRVRQIRGAVKDRSGHPLGSGVHVLVEVVSKGDPITTRTIHTDSAGRFQITGVAEGEYRFRIGLKEPGWACTEGTIIVSKSAPANSMVPVTLQLGR